MELAEREDQAEEQAEEVEELEQRLLAADWSPALVKSALDPFTYALRLRDGTLIVYEEAIPNQTATWVHLSDAVVRNERVEPYGTVQVRGGEERQWPGNGPFTFERGIDVRVADIVWVCDAPWGS